MRTIDVDPQERNLVVSQRAILIEQFEEAATLFWTQVQVGQRYSGTVAAIKDYGAIIDLGGVTGFLHIREMTWTRLKHPLDLLQQWQPVDVVVLSVDRTKQRVSLGMRQLSANPWSGIETRYRVGNNLVGKVSRTSEFGAFVELEPGIEGLIHISELDHQRVRKVSDVVKVGQKVHVRVLEIQPDRQRISLSLKALQQSSETDAADVQKTSVHRKAKTGPLRGRLDSRK
ncbi:S1 RNA-binding domain-containing protein [Schlesneria sp.]|uniref:S1 RNA-binding domain-containing protein n=1 Tax=Schlesneria sp. TaxID=2762018 RepID=UPI002F0DE182